MQANNNAVILSKEQEQSIDIHAIYVLLSLHNGWEKILDPLAPILAAIAIDLKKQKIKWYPSKFQVYLPFIVTPLYPEPSMAGDAIGSEGLKVVIFGQDPYYQPGVAMGLAFSIMYGEPFTQSLEKIFAEQKRSLGIPKPRNGCLLRWAIQGVLLLNASMIVEENRADSHTLAWTRFTPKLITAISKEINGLVFMLWGKNARDLRKYIEGKSHLILECAHPVAGARNGDSSDRTMKDPFLGSDHFKKTNEFLQKNGKKEIVW